MTPEQLQAIKERVENTSEGPWEALILLDGEYSVVGENPIPPVAMGLWDYDAEFIAHAREDVPALIAEVERLQGKLNDYYNRAEKLLEFATTKLEKNSMQIEPISIVNLVDSLVITQNKLDQVELAEAKARMENEALEFHLKVSINHAESVAEELEVESAENERLREALEDIQDIELNRLASYEEMEMKRIATQVLEGEQNAI